MRLSLIFDALASGELHNLHLVDDAKQVYEDKKELVLRSINLGLVDLYTRFDLKKAILGIKPIEETKVIKITEPDFIELISIKLNNIELHPNRQDGFMLLGINTLVLNKPVSTTDKIEVLYKARHKVLTPQDILDDNEVELPMAYLNALLYFIGSRLYTSAVNQLDSDLNESNRYLQKYHEELHMLEARGVDTDLLPEYWLFDKRGFI